MLSWGKITMCRIISAPLRKSGKKRLGIFCCLATYLSVFSKFYSVESLLLTTLTNSVLVSRKLLENLTGRPILLIYLLLFIKHCLNIKNIFEGFNVQFSIKIHLGVMWSCLLTSNLSFILAMLSRIKPPAIIKSYLQKIYPKIYYTSSMPKLFLNFEHTTSDKLLIID